MYAGRPVDMLVVTGAVADVNGLVLRTFNGLKSFTTRSHRDRRDKFCSVWCKCVDVFKFQEGKTNDTICIY